MKTPVCAVAALAGAALTAAAAAGPEPMLRAAPRTLAADRVGHIYCNPATGEMTRTAPGGPRGGSPPVWANEITDQCDYGEYKYDPIRDSATGEDTWAADLGDIPFNSCIDTITIFYATDLHDPEEDGEAGFELVLEFFDAADISTFGCSSFPFVEYVLSGLPGSAGGVAGWQVTIDLSDLGIMELGDDDRIDGCGSGIHSDGVGADPDGDGLADFAAGFHFNHPPAATAGVTGCVLAVPPERAFPNSLGDFDGMALSFVQDWGHIDGYYWFDGYDCAPGPGAWIPWASYYLGLYGSSGPPCPGDWNADGALDFFDIQAFLNAFAAEDPAADMNTDGAWDFFDIQFYLGLFSAGCP